MLTVLITDTADNIIGGYMSEIIISLVIETVLIIGRSQFPPKINQKVVFIHTQNRANLNGMMG